MRDQATSGSGRSPPRRISTVQPPAGAARPTVHDPVGCSRCLLDLIRTIDVVAPTDTTVLVTGETGTGKEVAARRIHALSRRAARPFVAVNCAALPENLIESELFGYVRGAFTGASGSRPGYFEQANAGTLFLDEVTDLPLPLQPKLLRALQDREIRRLGGTSSLKVDVRVVAAANGDLAEAVHQGRFRPDLFYRIRVIELHLPPLRERKEDIPLLCEHFIALHTAATRSPLHHVSPAALQAMEGYDWPGNVREVENVVERAMVLAHLDGSETLLPRHLPDEVRGAQGPEPEPDAGSAELDLAGAMRRLRRRYVAEALRVSRGNKVQAARLLGISRSALYDLLQETGAATQLPP